MTPTIAQGSAALGALALLSACVSAPVPPAAAPARLSPASGAALQRCEPLAAQFSHPATRIESALFDDWERWPDERFQTVMWTRTGERLTRENFAKYRAMGGGVQP